MNRPAARSRLPRGTSPAAVLKVREADIQRAVVQYLRKAPPRAIWFHVPNGGTRHVREAVAFKTLGVKPGVPDLVFLFETGAACIELKAGAGRLTGVQVAFAAECKARGIRHAVCTSVAEVHQVLANWGLASDRVALR